jgi:hypothetical protein
MASSAKQLICPRCKTGNFNSDRALTVHLNSESCRKLSLWGFTSKSTKRKSTFGSYSKFASSILDNMNKRHHSGLSRNVHCLSVNPSLSQLSSLPSDQRQSYFASTEDLEVDHNCEFEPANDEQIDNARETTTVTSTSSIQRSINPPSGIKFGIHLHEILSSHRGVDLSLYDEIIDTIKYHSTVHKTDFSATKLYHRKELTTTLSDLYKFNEMKPVMHKVTISDGSVVTVPVFDVKAVLLSILHDPKRMRYENFAMNYDVFLGKPTQAVTHYDEIHTGNL